MANEKSKLQSLGEYQWAGREASRAQGTPRDARRRAREARAGAPWLLCQQLPGRATLTSPICSSTCSRGSTAAVWLRLGLRQPKRTGVLRDDEEAPEDGDEGGGGGGEARISSGSAMGPAGAAPSNRTRTNGLSTARAQSPQAPPPPPRGPAPSSLRSPLGTTPRAGSQDVGAEHYNSQKAERLIPALLSMRVRAAGKGAGLVGLFRRLGSWMRRMAGRWSLWPFPCLCVTQKPYWPSGPPWRRRKAEEGAGTPRSKGERHSPEADFSEAVGASWQVMAPPVA